MELTKQNQKEYERGLIQSVDADCTNCMKRCFERDGYRKGLINLSLAATRQEILENVAENEIERNYLDKNYEKILNKVKKIYENDTKAKLELAKEAQAKEQQQQAKEQQKINAWKTLGKGIFTIFKWIFIVLFGGIYLIFKIIADMANNMYK